MKSPQELSTLHLITSKSEQYFQQNSAHSQKSDKTGSRSSTTSQSHQQELAKIAIPSFKVIKIATRKRSTGELRKGYYRYLQAEFPPRRFIELTQDDYEFIQAEKLKYRFYSFYLLCPDTLLQAFIFLNRLSEDKQQQPDLKSKLTHALTDRQGELHFSLLEVVEIEQPQLLLRFIEMLINRWQYKVKQGALFALNIPEMSYTPMAPYSCKQVFKRGRPTFSSSSMKRTSQKKFVAETVVLLQEHAKRYEEFQERKRYFLSIVDSFLRSLTEANSEVFCDLARKDQSPLTLLELEEKLKSLLLRLQKQKKQLSVQEISPTKDSSIKHIFSNTNRS